MIFRESDRDTIAAIATASGEGGIGIVRISGTDAIAIAGRIFEPHRKKDTAGQKSFTASYGHVVTQKPAGTADVVDEAILLLMRAPKSYTAEDVAELQVHGGSAVLQAVLTLAVREGARLAAPGEFTKRAFLNGRIDLLQAEAVLDLIQARTDRSRRWASAQLEGILSVKAREIKTELLEILAHLEASIDFPEDDVEAADTAVMEKKLSAIKFQIDGLLKGSELGILAKRGLRAVFWGRPNTGKSSLMNRLARQNRVIVTPEPGTTRDVVEEEIQIDGFPVRLTDTAGIQETDHPIEKEGVARSRKAAAGADVILFVLDASAVVNADDKTLYREAGAAPKIIILNKCDLPAMANVAGLEDWDQKIPVIKTSCQTGQGIENLEKEILRSVTGSGAGAEAESVVSSIRLREALEKISAALQESLLSCRGKASPELIAVDVRVALDHLGVMVGDIITDDVLDILFNKFCIGK